MEQNRNWINKLNSLFFDCKYTFLFLIVSLSFPIHLWGTGTTSRDLDRDGTIDLTTPLDGGYLKTQMFFYLDQCKVVNEMTKSCELDYQCKTHFIWYYWTGEAYESYRQSIAPQLREIDPNTIEGREKILALSTPTTNPQFKRQAIMDMDGILTAFCQNESGNGCMSVEACLENGKKYYPGAVEDQFPEVPFTNSPVDFSQQRGEQ